MTRTLLATAIIFAVCAGPIVSSGQAQRDPKPKQDAGKSSKGKRMSNRPPVTEEEWRKRLTPEQYRVLRQKGTERAFTGKFWNHHADGSYTCAACGHSLFRSTQKFDSGCGWPSFWDAADPDAVKFNEDNSLGMRRVEVTCANCGGHLGHIFDDGPNPTGKRFCINSASIDFKPKTVTPRK